MEGGGAVKRITLREKDSKKTERQSRRSAEMTVQGEEGVVET